MPFYESVIIARQDLSTQQVEALTEQMTGVVTENGGKVEKTEQWGLRSMAYKIKKNRKGHYVQLTMDAPHRRSVTNWNASWVCTKTCCAA